MTRSKYSLIIGLVVVAGVLMAVSSPAMAAHHHWGFGLSYGSGYGYYSQPYYPYYYSTPYYSYYPPSYYYPYSYGYSYGYPYYGYGGRGGWGYGGHGGHSGGGHFGGGNFGGGGHGQSARLASSVESSASTAGGLPVGLWAKMLRLPY